MNLIDADLNEMKKGFIETENSLMCLMCNKSIEKGLIYPVGEHFYEALKFMKLHIKQEHESVFAYLMEQDKEITGLSDQQKAVLHLLFEGKADREIQDTLKIGSASTVRNHRFSLKKKERQAKVYLTLMSLMEEGYKLSAQSKEDARLFEEPFHITEREYREVLKKNWSNGKLRTFNLQEKHRFIVLCEIVKKFQPGKIYTEREVNVLIKEVFDDHTFVRRYLVMYHFLARKTDGSAYWVKEKEGMDADRKKELKQQVKDEKTIAGVYCVTNKENGKMYIASTLNLKRQNGLKFELNGGTLMNKDLQRDWELFGEDAFQFEVLESIETEGKSARQLKEELTEAKENWCVEKQPYGERGYN
ncbi:DUF2087 domain-containing protein [Paenisporosarcina quisquiliarum]|uniref:DUF2087 domain-containing protein n=1 Tax=Paenisporosarcina quisquiliarum TaxID=365346 RepID=A0A9X3LI09_9BACL|nr:DUF2087 domain-containing protein [Paenisporosarcina quisquiliarum]MCZ8536829.1 DUF2087 domain-containing protein [Paenisporosarcina quisquiliarum]